MPWSPIPKFPTIVKQLKDRGNIEETDVKTLRTEIKRITGVMRPETIANIIETMEELGFIKKCNGNTNIFWLYNGNEYEFEAERRKLQDIIEAK